MTDKLVEKIRRWWFGLCPICGKELNWINASTMWQEEFFEGFCPEHLRQR
jgi:endogenous inhibitor of DNA gyrase (YacG/DUF329 family)